MNKFKAILAIIVIILGSLVGFSLTQNKECINLYVDYGNLERPTFDKCLSATSNTKAIALLKGNGFNLQGTEKYGEGVLCRLNGLPKDAECKVMPSEKAYWAILEKRDNLIFESYAWSQVGIDQIILSPGDSLALVFATNGEVRFPK